MKDQIIKIITDYLNKVEVPKEKWDGTVGFFPAEWPLPICTIADEIAEKIAAAIAPHLEAAPKKCGSCGVNEARLLHACPYREELYNDEETPCDCCFECTGQCRDRV